MSHLNKDNKKLTSQKKQESWFNFNGLKESAYIIYQLPLFWPACLIILGLLTCFWPLVSTLPKQWLKDDGYYSHGFLVPFLSAYVVYSNWDRLSRIKVKPGYIALLPLIFTLFLLRAALSTDIDQVSSICLVMTILFSVWFLGGFRWMLAVTLPIAFLIFALPVWTGFIDEYTNPLQLYSTKIAFYLLKLLGLQPFMTDNTIIMLSQFTLDVGVPCSGLKLLMAVSAFTIFFTLIARLRWWGNLLMALSVIPLCLFINGLRIALIGVVGNAYGTQAGLQFHDYSGYIVLLVCFYLLFKFARLLGWKD